MLKFLSRRTTSRLAGPNNDHLHRLTFFHASQKVWFTVQDTHHSTSDKDWEIIMEKGKVGNSWHYVQHAKQLFRHPQGRKGRTFHSPGVSSDETVVSTSAIVHA